MSPKRDFSNKAERTFRFVRSSNETEVFSQLSFQTQYLAITHVSWLEVVGSLQVLYHFDWVDK